MPTTTYFIRFIHREPGSIPYEEQEHILLPEAWETFRLFAEPGSSEMYSGIELAAHNWDDDTETPIATMTFAAPYSF